MSFIVAIDGPAGSGKGTVAKQVAKETGFINIDTGAMYRCVALSMIQNKIEIDEEEKIKKLLEDINIELKKDGNVYLDGKEVTGRIREVDVSNFASSVAVLSIIRTKLSNLQRKVSEGIDVVMEGRDIGTSVFPSANVKVYLDAKPEERARRRVIQNEEKGVKASYEEVLESIIDRDKRDSSRKESPLKMAKDAVYIDSSDMTIEEVVSKIINMIENVR